ncbi:hypothetical protein HQQ80_11620 [Microbacteriaceae bacterium VKM Ac-2855]|nr:hypothetical protein [Microbacteriaceae bacterium VKM Ac-2855]
MLLVALLVVGVIGISSAIQRENEAKVAAVAEWNRLQTNRDAALRDLEETINDASALVLSTNADQLTDAGLLDGLRASLDASQGSSAEWSDATPIDTDTSSRQIVEDDFGGLKESRSEINVSRQELEAAIESVESDKATKSERLAAEKRAAEAAALAARQAAAKAAAQPTTYEELFRAGDSVTGNYYRFEGKIIQDASGGTYRVNMTKDPGYSLVFWEDTILVSISGTTSQRLLEDDIISFTAASGGIESYTTIFGATVELPLVTASAQDVAVTGRDN